MADYSTIFSAPMITASCEGRKHQTRQLAWQRKKNIFGTHSATIWQYVQPGDKLWCRETWRTLPEYDHLPPRDVPVGAPFLYECDDPDRSHRLGLWGKVRQSIFMPRWASRLTLVVTGARVEKLQAISEEDAVAEGVEIVGVHIHRHYRLYRDYLGHNGHGHESAVKSFSTLWRSLHTKPSTTWKDNPDVVVLSFDPHYCNIDRMEKEGEVA